MSSERGIVNRINCAMRKLEIAHFKYFENSVKGNFAQTDDDFWLDNFYLAFEIWLAIIQLCRTRLIIGRSATPRSGNVHILENKTIASGLRLSLVRKSGPVQRREKKSARSIASELTTCAVRAVCAGGKSYHEYACLRVAKARDRFAPIFMIFIGFAFNVCNFLTPLHQPGTFTALDYFFVERVKWIQILAPAC